MTVTVFVAFIMGIGAVIAFPAGIFYLLDFDYGYGLPFCIAVVIVILVMGKMVDWSFLLLLMLFPIIWTCHLNLSEPLTCKEKKPAQGNPARLSISADEVAAEPAKGNPARLSISADEVAATGKAFIIVNEKMNYGMARATCKNMGGDLATFKNVKEQKRIMAWAHAKFPEIIYAYIGVQIKTEQNKNEWKWLTGESIPNEDAFAWAFESQRKEKKSGPGALGLNIATKGHQGFQHLTLNPYVAPFFAFICEIDEY